MKVRANGIEMNYVLEGPADAPVVTMSHSLATTLDMWNPQAAALAKRYRVVRYETRGHGSTEAPKGPYTLDLLAADARALLDALKIRRTHWVGLSMGGMIGQALALAAPDRLLSLALCDTSSRVPPEMRPTWDERVQTAEQKGMEPLVEPTIARWFTPDFIKRKSDVVETVRAMIRKTPVAGYVGCCQAIKMLDLTDRISAITLPTIVIVGEDDPGTPVAASRTIAERIKAAELAILPKAAHLSNIEQAEAFTSTLTRFLNARAA